MGLSGTGFCQVRPAWSYPEAGCSATAGLLRFLMSVQEDRGFVASRIRLGISNREPTNARSVRRNTDERCVCLAEAE